MKYHQGFMGSTLSPYQRSLILLLTQTGFLMEGARLGSNTQMASLPATNSGPTSSLRFDKGGLVRCSFDSKLASRPR